MLFISKEGDYIEILRKNYTTDTAYYTAIIKLKGQDIRIKQSPVKLIL